MDKPVIRYKVLKQAATIGGKFYAVVNNSQSVTPALTMQQIVEYKKLYSYNPKQLVQIVEDVLQGAAELVARDGIARNVSSLLKFESRIKGTFKNTEAIVTSDQKVIVSPRMLKDIRVDIDRTDFTFENTNDNTAPKILSVAIESDEFTGWNLAAFKTWQLDGYSIVLPIGPLTISGTRLCPTGWTDDCALGITLRREGEVYLRLDRVMISGGDVDTESGAFAGTPLVASENVVKIGYANDSNPATPPDPCYYWKGIGDAPLNARKRLNAYDFCVEPVTLANCRMLVTPQVGDEINFQIGRNLQDGSGSFVIASKTYTITE